MRVKCSYADGNDEQKREELIMENGEKYWKRRWNLDNNNVLVLGVSTDN